MDGSLFRVDYSGLEIMKNLFRRVVVWNEIWISLITFRQQKIVS